MEYNFWDDRTHELDVNPCDGCEDYQNGECVSNGGCASHDIDCERCSHSYFEDGDKLRCKLDVCTPKYD